MLSLDSQQRPSSRCAPTPHRLSPRFSNGLLQRARPTSKTRCRRQRGASEEPAGPKGRDRRCRGRDGAGRAAKRRAAARHKAAVFSEAGTGILMGTEVRRGIMPLHAARTAHARYSAALAGPRHQFLPNKYTGNEKRIEQLSGDRHVPGLPEGSLLPGCGRERGQTALPGPGLPRSPRGARHRHSAVFRAPMAKRSSFPRRFPSPGFSHPCNYPQLKSKASRILPSHFG